MSILLILLVSFVTPTAVLRAQAVVGSPTSLPTAPPAEPIAAITLESGERVTAESDRGLFERVGLRPNELVSIVLHYPVAKAGRVIVPSPLDGGRVIASQRALTIAADGTLQFRFQAGREPGIYQISLRDGVQESGLEFWVLDDRNPEKNPPVKNKQS